MKSPSLFHRLGLPAAGLCLLASFGFVAVLGPIARGDESPLPEELFADDFTELDPSLGDPSDVLGVKDHVLFRKQEQGYYWRTFYDALVFDDADATIRVRLPDWQGETDGIIGLAFWGANLDEYYLLEISDAGTYSVARVTATSWSRPVSWRSTDVLKTEPGAWNELRVVTSGSRATIYINGKEMVSIKGRPPANGSLFGVFAQAGKADLLCEYSALRILQGPPPAEGDAASDPNVLFSDEFATLDPGWGSEQGWFGVREKHLKIGFDPNQSFKSFYDGGAFADAEITVKVRTVTEKTSGGPASGIVFWAQNYEEFYLLQVFAEGSVCVARRTKGEWKYPLSARPFPTGATFDPKDWTTLRLVASGKKATAYVNGVKAATFPGQPPKGDWKIGVYGQSGDTASESQFSELVVRKP